MVSLIKSTFAQPTVYTLYLAYAGYYLPRKSDSVVKSALVAQGFSVDQIAVADTVYLFTYTIAMLFSGTFGSRYPPNKLLFVSMLGLCCVSILKSFTLSPWSFAFAQFLHAIAQSTGWPTCIRVLSSWIVKDRGFLMGVWTTCQSLGGVLGAFLASYMLTSVSYSFAYLGHVPFLIIIAFLCLKNVSESPTMPSSPSFQMSKQHAPAETNISFLTLITTGTIFSVALSYFFLKFLRYALLLWLPFYFEEALNFPPDVSGYLSSAFEIGGLFGTPFIGYISDNFVNKDLSKTAAYFMLFATFALIYCILVANFGIIANGLAMIAVGVLVIGPDSVMSGSVISDLVLESGFGTEAVGKVAGLINAIGSCGAIFQSGTTAYISTEYGWITLFWFFVVCSFLSSSVLFIGIWTNKGKRRIDLYNSFKV